MSAQACAMEPVPSPASFEKIPRETPFFNVINALPTIPPVKERHSGAKFRRFDVCQPDGGHIVFAGKFDQIVKMFLIGNPAVAVLVDGRKRKVVDCRSFDIGNRTVAGFKLSLKVFCRDVFGIVKSFVGGGSRIECAQRLFPC